MGLCVLHNFIYFGGNNVAIGSWIVKSVLLF